MNLSRIGFKIQISGSFRITFRKENNRTDGKNDLPAFARSFLLRFVFILATALMDHMCRAKRSGVGLKEGKTLKTILYIIIMQFV